MNDEPITREWIEGGRPDPGMRSCDEIMLRDSCPMLAAHSVSDRRNGSQSKGNGSDTVTMSWEIRGTDERWKPWNQACPERIVVLTRC